jgi:hypothetical protein
VLKQHKRWSAKPGAARSELDGEEVLAEAPFVALGGEPRAGFESSWQSHHFESIPRV